ncbi:nucleotide exchange factor GrpE [Candidatus Woesearchaeota archaeon]|nr:nucleotide exchange factor GrpE [Candidatus Woesearchaeota archaeon]
MVRKPEDKRPEQTASIKPTEQNPAGEEKEKQLKEAQQKTAEYLDHLQRLQAEFDNYRKRTEKERQLIIKQANQELIQKVLIIIDSLELAFKTIKTEDDFSKGIKMIYSEIYTLLEKEGLRKIECLGKKFDPHIHEAMLQKESDKPEGTILEEMQKGYMLNDRVIRFSKVIVSKEKTDNTPLGGKQNE